VVRGFLEIDAHDDLEPVGQPFTHGGEAFGVRHRRDGIVDRTGTDDDEEALIGSVEDGFDGVTRCQDDARCGQGTRDLAHHLFRSIEFFYFLDSKVVGRTQHGCGSCF
jgi:hypothetical protein